MPKRRPRGRPKGTTKPPDEKRSIRRRKFDADLRLDRWLRKYQERTGLSWQEFVMLALRTLAGHREWIAPPEQRLMRRVHKNRTANSPEARP